MYNHKEVTDEIINEAMNSYAKQVIAERDFIESKKYIEVLDSIVGKCVDSDDYREPTRWTDDVQMLFNVIYNSALDLIVKTLDFDDEIIINYKGNLMSFVEMHGQGCFQSISPIEKYGDIEHKEYIVDFDDLENFMLTRKQPKRLYVMKTVFLALDSLELFNNHYGVDVDIDEIKDYIQENLN